MKSKREYILFVFQAAQFNPTFIMVPAIEFIQARKDDYQILIDSSEKNVKFDVGDEYYNVNNLITLSIEDGKPANTKYSKICQDINTYAYMNNSGVYFIFQDKLWVDDSKCGTCTNSDNIEGYIKEKQKLRKKGYKIIDSFLVLEKNWYDESTDNLSVD